MAILLLARGDEEARTLMRKAIEARYGTRPLFLDSIQLGFKGRARVKVGPVMTWVPLVIDAYLRFPDTVRWDFTVKPMGLPVQRGVEAVFGDVYRSERGKRKEMKDDPALVDNLRQRLWSLAALLLTPMAESYVTLESVGPLAFTATNTQTQDSATVQLNDDYSIASVSIDCLNLESGQEQTYTLRAQSEIVSMDDVALPGQVTAFWDDQPHFEVQLTSANYQTELPDSLFTGRDTAAIG